MSTRTPKSAGSKPRRAKTPAKTASTRSGSRVRGGRMMQSIPAVLLRALEKPQALLVPGAAALGAGALATTGLILRQQLGHLLRSAAEGAVSRASAAADGASLRALLSHAGLTRKRTLASFLRAGGPWIGLAAGVIAAGAATAFLAPSAKRLVRDKRAHVNGVAEPLKTSASPSSAAHSAS
jgi:hypothetical protein